MDGRNTSKRRGTLYSIRIARSRSIIPIRFWGDLIIAAEHRSNGSLSSSSLSHTASPRPSEQRRSTHRRTGQTHMCPWNRSRYQQTGKRLPIPIPVALFPCVELAPNPNSAPCGTEMAQQPHPSLLNPKRSSPDRSPLRYTL